MKIGKKEIIKLIVIFKELKLKQETILWRSINIKSVIFSYLVFVEKTIYESER